MGNTSGIKKTLLDPLRLTYCPGPLVRFLPRIKLKIEVPSPRKRLIAIPFRSMIDSSLFSESVKS